MSFAIARVSNTPQDVQEFDAGVASVALESPGSRSDLGR